EKTRGHPRPNQRAPGPGPPQRRCHQRASVARVCLLLDRWLSVFISVHLWFQKPLALPRRGRRLFLDRRAHQVAPLGPRPVVILHVVVAEQVLQHKPRVRAAFSDAAIRNHLARAVDPLRPVELLQRLQRFERAILVRRLRPRTIRRSPNMPGALRCFRHPRRRDDLPSEFIYRSDVHQLSRFLLLEKRGNILFPRADRLIRPPRTIRRGSRLRRIGRQRALLFQPLLAPAVHQPDVLVPVIFQLPKRVSREPVVVVAVEDPRRVFPYARLAQQPLERDLVNQIAPEVVLQLRLPVPANSSGDVPLIVSRGVHVHLNQPHFRIVLMFRHPLRRNQHFGMLVICHFISPVVVFSFSSEARKTKNPPANSSLAVGSSTPGLDFVLASQPPPARGRASTHAAATAAAAPDHLAALLHRQKAYTRSPPVAMDF